jgi:hypothetical protein
MLTSLLTGNWLTINCQFMNSELTANYEFPLALVYSLNMDCIENTASSSSSVAWASIA